MKLFPEDLMQTVIAADATRRRRVGEPPPQFKLWKRHWIEPWFNLLGEMIGQILVMMPWPLRWRADQKIVQWMGARPSNTGPSLEARRGEMAALARRLHEESGQWPAVLVLTSHPTTVGQNAWLRFEVARQGLMLGNAVVDVSQAGRWFRSAPECFLAIDPYALDTVPTPVAGLYAGFMNRIYLVSDRMSKTQGALQRWLLLRRTGYPDIARRLIQRLKRGVPVVMVQPGGLPQNARLLYAAREFVQCLPVAHWPYPKRQAQEKWMRILTQPVEGFMPCETGDLPESTCVSLRQLLAEWGFSIPDQERWLDIFSREFALEVPYRVRLFRVLLRQVVAEGKPLMVVAVTHQGHAPYIQISSPWGVSKGPESFYVRRGPDDLREPLVDMAQTAMDFSKEFIV